MSRLWGQCFAVQPTGLTQHLTVTATPPSLSTPVSFLRKPRSSERKSLAFALAQIWDVARAHTWTLEARKYLQISQFKYTLSFPTCKRGTRALMRSQQLSSPVRSIERFV